MSKVFTPRVFQKPAIEHIIANKRCGLWMPMGGGKTVSVLTALDYLSVLEDCFPCLIVAPLRVAKSTWPDEVRKWEHLSHLRVSVITGKASERVAALRAQADIYTINYENLPWLNTALGTAWPFKTVVADESTKLKSFRLRQGSARARALALHARATPRFIELTGTPSPNGLVDLWGQAWFLDFGARLGTSFKAFEQRWFNARQVGMDKFATKLSPTKTAQAQIEDALRDLCMSVDVAQYLDIKDPVFATVEVELPARARELYTKMEKELFISLADDIAVEAFSAASRTMKCLQLANGAIYTEGEKFQVVHDEKIAALESIIEEASGAPVLVAYHFKSDLARLMKAFPYGKKLDTDPKTITEWNKGKVPLLFAYPGSTGHGLNLQDGGNILVFFGHDWNLEDYMQIIERIGPVRQAQAGHNRPVFIYHIVAKDTIDEVVIKRRDTKRSVQELLMEAMQQRKEAQ